MDYLTLFVALALANAVLGLALFEWTWNKIKPIRDMNKAIDDKYYAFKRLDVARWQKWKFQLAAATVALPKFAGVFVVILLSATIAKIVTIGVTISPERPLSGWRNTVVNFVIKLGCNATLFFACIQSEVKELNHVDYSYYLGKDYKET